MHERRLFEIERTLATFVQRACKSNMLTCMILDSAAAFSNVVKWVWAVSASFSAAGIHQAKLCHEHVTGPQPVVTDLQLAVHTNDCGYSNCCCVTVTPKIENK